MHITKNEMFKDVLFEYPRLAVAFQSKKEWDEMSENELWQELCLCILSSNVPYELARSAFFQLLRKGYLQLRWIVSAPDSQEMIANELAKPLYSPKRLNGSYRRYRFPNVRSKNICQAANIVSSDKDWLSELLATSSSEEEVRDFLVANIPGLGLKQASHFLRNIKFSQQLAIIDSHVRSFLVRVGAAVESDAKAITPKDYLRLESRLQEICSKYGLNISIADMAIWRCMRREK